MSQKGGCAASGPVTCFVPLCADGVQHLHGQVQHGEAPPKVLALQAQLLPPVRYAAAQQGVSQVQEGIIQLVTQNFRDQGNYSAKLCTNEHLCGIIAIAAFPRTPGEPSGQLFVLGHAGAEGRS